MPLPWVAIRRSVRASGRGAGARVWPAPRPLRGARTYERVAKPCQTASYALPVMRALLVSNDLWGIERTLSWLLGCCRLGVRDERRADLWQRLLQLVCTLISLRFLAPLSELRFGPGAALSRVRLPPFLSAR